MAKESDQTRWRGIRPTDPAEDIPTTTKKLAPAIADLQAPQSIVRASVVNTAVAGNNLVTVYTVPAGKLFQMQCNQCLCDSAAPVNIVMHVDVAGEAFYFATPPYGGAWDIVLITIPMLLNEGEIIKHNWIACTIGDTLWDKVMGYLIDKY